MQVRMVLERETKGAVRYKEVNPDGSATLLGDAVIGTLYIRKTALHGIVPQEITVTVDAHIKVTA